MLWVKKMHVKLVEIGDIIKNESNVIWVLRGFYERKDEDDILIFLAVYNIQPYDYVRAFLKSSKKSIE